MKAAFRNIFYQFQARIKHHKKWLLALLLSSGFHILFILGLLWPPSFLNLNPQLIEEEKLQTVEIHILEPDDDDISLNDSSPQSKSQNRFAKKEPTPLQTPPTQSTASKSNKGTSSPIVKRLNLLGPSYVDVVDNKIHNPESSSLEGHEDILIATKHNYDFYSKNGAFGYSNEGGIAKSLENHHFYSYLWQKVRFHSGFPDDFVKYRLNGKTRIHFVVNHKGQILGDFLKANSTDSFLELYSMAILVKALQEPLDPQHWAKEKQIPVVFEFNYSLITDLVTWENVKLERGGHHENTFKITNYRFVASDLEQTLIDLYKDYWPPILPMPGGGFIDFIELYDKYQRYIVKKDFRSSDQRRLDDFHSINLKELLQIAINKPESELIERMNSGSLLKKTFNSSPSLTEKFMIPSTRNSQDLSR